jgi:hypothetical protein
MSKNYLPFCKNAALACYNATVVNFEVIGLGPDWATFSYWCGYCQLGIFERATLLHCKRFVLNRTQDEWGLVLGDFLAENRSGRPVFLSPSG